MDLKNIETLVDRLSERVEALLDERNQLRQEIERLKAYAAERDKDCADLRLEMARAVEAAAEEARDTDRTNAEIVSKLEALNKRMVTLAELASKGELLSISELPESADGADTSIENKNESENEAVESQLELASAPENSVSGLLVGQIDQSRWDGDSRDPAAH